MPYDPDGELGREDYNGLEYEGDGGMYEEGEEDFYDDQLGDFEEPKDMGIDLPQPELSPHQHQHHKHHDEYQDATPRHNLHHNPSTAVAGPGRISQLEVVLHSSPKKNAFISTVDQVPENEGDAVDLITSDLIPQPGKKPPILSAAAPESVPPLKRPADAFTPLPTITPQPKKRGRPFGWKKGSGPYSAMTRTLPPPSSTPRPKPKKPSSEQGPRKRPGRKPAPTARQIYLKLNPHFLTFRCEWENCPAELQNVETLRKHLLIVHGRPLSSPPKLTPPTTTPSSPRPPPPPPPPTQGSPTCKWKACAHPLPSKEAFANHIETAHLAPFLWHIGDGPRNTSSTPSSHSQQPTNTTNTSPPPLPSYLFDVQGNQVTPSVHNQQVENEDDRKRRQARINRVLLQRDRNAPEEPQYDPDALDEMAAFMSAKRARQRMLREYAERVVCGGGGVGEGWRGVVV